MGKKKIGAIIRAILEGLTSSELREQLADRLDDIDGTLDSVRDLVGITSRLDELEDRIKKLEARPKPSRRTLKETVSG